MPHGGAKYCNQQCLNERLLADTAAMIPKDVIDAELMRVHEGPCPVCHGPGPIDFHDSHSAISLIVVTRLSTSSVLGCKACGKSRQLSASMQTLATGWWSLTGLVMTPAQIITNFVAMAKKPKPGNPSPKLRQYVTRVLSHNILVEATQPMAVERADTDGENHGAGSSQIS